MSHRRAKELRKQARKLLAHELENARHRAKSLMDEARKLPFWKRLPIGLRVIFRP